MQLIWTPRADLRLLAAPEADLALVDATVVDPALVHAFARGTGDGLLHLGTAMLGADLPAPFAFARALARDYFTQLAAAADDDTAGSLPTIAPDPARLAERAAAVPPMPGAEYVSHETLAVAWLALHASMRAELSRTHETLQAWFERHAPAYNTLGRIVFHLAEYKADPARPFAFMASWALGVGDGAKIQHVPLQRAVEQYGTERAALVKMLRPLAAAANHSPWARQQIESRAVYHPCTWTAAEAFALLREVPALRAAGISVRMPPGWAQGRPPRVRAAARVGGRASGGLGFDAILDFDVALAIDGEPLHRAEAKALLAGAAGLRLVRGRWVEVDPERIAETLARYESVQKLAAKEGLTFAEALRLLASAPREGDTSADDGDQPWALVTAGPWLADVFARLRSPEGRAESDPGAALHAELRPYQRAGVAWLWTLWSLGTGGCLADDMGLGKTVQVIALCLLIARSPGRGKAQRVQHLVVAPASVLDNWARELARFAPSLEVAIVHRSRATEIPIEDADVVLTTYATLPRQPALAERRWGLVVVDEAQAIKNPAAAQTRAVKKLSARTRLALTGTPVENRLTDLWSVLDFATPGLLGGAKEFSAFTKKLAGGSYAPLRELCRPWILRRLKSDRRVIDDLPDKTELDVACGLSKKQAALYAESVEALAGELAEAKGVRRRGIVLAYLTRLKQICNHPSHWLGDGGWEHPDSGKLMRLRALAEEIAARQDKVLVFTQFREACDPLARHLTEVFGRPGLILHGDVAVRKRAQLVEAFASEDGPPFFVLSLRAGGTGLNLTAANHVIHFDRWWNPAVENQATDRAYRIGQHRNVLVHRFVCRGTIEDRVAAMLVAKRALADDVLAGEGEVALTELPTEDLLRLVRLDVRAAFDVE